MSMPEKRDINHSENEYTGTCEQTISTEKNHMAEEPCRYYEYIDKIYHLAIQLQEYCKQNALPIFNKLDTATIILDSCIASDATFVMS